MASIDYQAQYDWQSVQKKGVFELNTTDVILAQSKIMTQQMEALTQQMAKLPQQLQAVQAARMLPHHCVVIFMEEIMQMRIVHNRLQGEQQELRK